MKVDFDERAASWDSSPEHRERARVIAAAIRENAVPRPGMSAFEYGCGTGLVSFALRDALKDLTLADSSAGMLEVVAKNIQSAGVRNMHPLKLDLTKEAAPPQAYDLIYTVMTLHHVDDPKLVLARFLQMLRPSGRLCVADLDREDGSFHGANVESHHGFDREELSDWLRGAGFGQVRISTVYTITREKEGRTRRFSVFLAVADRPA